MLAALTLSLALTFAGAPADLAPTAAVATPAPTQCADATSAQLLGPVFTSLGEIAPTSTCSEDCDGYPDVSCTGNSCQAVARNCPSQRGYVVCDGNYSYCAPCGCNEGAYREVETGICCSCSDGELFELEQCINGQWEPLYSYCSPGRNCPLCP